jgi:hypothetical protein
MKYAQITIIMCKNKYYFLGFLKRNIYINYLLKYIKIKLSTLAAMIRLIKDKTLPKITEYDS